MTEERRVRLETRVSLCDGECGWMAKPYTMSGRGSQTPLPLRCGGIAVDGDETIAGSGEREEEDGCGARVCEGEMD